MIGSQLRADLLALKAHCQKKRDEAVEVVKAFDTLLRLWVNNKEVSPYLPEGYEEFGWGLIQEKIEMKPIRFGKQCIVVEPGMELQLEDNSFSHGAEAYNSVGIYSETKGWNLYKGDRCSDVFEALIQFLAGREVLFDVDKFVAQLERKEGSKL